MSPDRTHLRHVALLGAGHVARAAHLPGWESVPGVRVVAACDPDPAARARLATIRPDITLFENEKELLSARSLELDAVSVCAPATCHLPLAKSALRAGLHVYCEKPLCISAAETAELGRVATEASRILSVRHQLRFSAAARVAQTRVAELGTVYHIRVRALRRDRIPTTPGLTDAKQAGGGALLDYGVHVLDLALWLTGFPRAVRATGVVRTAFAHGDEISGHWGEWDRTRFTVEDFAVGLVRFDDGLTLSLECAWAGHYREDAQKFADGELSDGYGVTLFGTRGALHWPTDLHAASEAEGLAGISATGLMADAPIPYDSGFADFVAFAAACRGEAQPPVPWSEAGATLAILEALYLSALEGREVEVKREG